MERYFPLPINIKKTYKNPYRIDKSPGCTFKRHPHKGLIFIDWSTAITYDCFDICREENKLNNFKDVMLIIDRDFNLNISAKNFKIKPFQKENKVIYLLPENTDSSEKKLEFNLKTLTKSWDDQSLKYWESYNITKETLIFFKTAPCVKANLNGKLWVSTKNNPIYEYSQKEGIQLYRPLAKKENGRFTQNLSAGYLMGLEQLPEKGENLIITKSYKDVMTLYQIGIPSVCPIGESGIVNDDIIKNLKNRFNSIITLFDNDDSGYKGAYKLYNKYNFPIFMIPSFYNIKDVSEFVKKKGATELKNLLKNYAN